MGNRYVRRLTIFEGADGCGKSTAAIDYAAATGAIYVHMSNVENAGEGLSRMFVEAMLPALNGHQDVVMDRCWMSEPIYSQVFRNGRDRVHHNYESLERLAMRCDTVVVHCRPPSGTATENFSSRLDEEMLDDVEQHSQVYALYGTLRTALPVVVYDYTMGELPSLLLDATRTTGHPMWLKSAGNITGRNILVGDWSPNVYDVSPYRSWAGVEISPRMFPGKISDIGLMNQMLSALALRNAEPSILWLDQRQPLWSLDKAIPNLHTKNVVAMGQPAAVRFYERTGVTASVMMPPSEFASYDEILDWGVHRYLETLA